MQKGNPGKCAAATRALAASLLVGVAMAAIAAAPAYGKQVVVVTSGEDAPYVAASDEARKLLSQQGHEVKVMTLDKYTKSSGATAGPSADVCVAVGTKAALALHRDIRPPAQLVYCMVSGVEAAGLSEGAAANGVGTDVPLQVQLKLIAEALPGARTVGMLYRSDVPASAALVKAMQDALPPEMKLVSVAVDKRESVAAAIEALLDQKVNVIWTAADSAVYNVNTVRAMLLAAVRRQTPVFGFSPAFVNAGALLGVGIEPRKQGAQAAGIVARLVREPATAPQVSPPAAITEPPAFQIAVNLIVAERLAVTLPPGLVARADIVFRPEGGE